MGGAHPTSRRPAGVWSRSARTSTGRTTRWLVFAARRGDAVDVGLSGMSAARKVGSTTCQFRPSLVIVIVPSWSVRKSGSPVRRSRLIVSEWGWP